MKNFKSKEAVKYLISVWDEVQLGWRQKPDHVQRKFLLAEEEYKSNTSIDISNDDFWFEKFNERYPDEVRQILNNEK